MIWPFVERDVVRGMSFGLSAASYDVRIAESVTIYPGEFVLASTMERFCIPKEAGPQHAREDGTPGKDK